MGDDSKEVAVLGVGRHPWGKWGRNFVEYGVHAARKALDDAGMEWKDIEFVSGGDTIRNGYPGYVAGATFAQALGWTGARVASSCSAGASGAGGMGPQGGRTGGRGGATSFVRCAVRLRARCAGSFRVLGQTRGSFSSHPPSRVLKNG